MTQEVQIALLCLFTVVNAGAWIFAVVHWIRHHFGYRTRYIISVDPRCYDIENVYLALKKDPKRALRVVDYKEVRPGAIVVLTDVDPEIISQIRAWLLNRKSKYVVIPTNTDARVYN